MRARMGFAGVLGLGVAVAAGASQLPTVVPAPQRSAVLLPPQPLDPSDTTVVARASSEELPSFLETTPVTRRTPVAAGPGWINGTDTTVRPAGGIIGTKQPLIPGSPATAPGQALPAGPRPLDRIKGVLTLDQPAPAFTGTPGAATPNTAFRGTTLAGSPVYAGPPAYRWYGWGSVTPGANPHAPTGQYPQASANWHAITGATPGAFPVPVTHPSRPTPGTEPPVYVVNPPQRTPPVYPAHGTVSAPPATVTPFVPPQESPRFNPGAEPRIAPPAPTPPPPAAVAPVGVPTLPVAPVTVPTLTPIPPLTAPPPMTNQPAPRAENLVPPPGPMPVIPAAPVAETPAPAVQTAVPAPLPVSVTDDQPAWQPSRQKSGGEWSPPRTNAPTQKSGAPQSGANVPPGQSVARGQVGDARPDVAVTLIQNLCHGRATGVEVRWTGSNRLTVTFGCPTPAAAEQLVKDISARPELAPLRIDFSVTLK